MLLAKTLSEIDFSKLSNIIDGIIEAVDERPFIAVLIGLTIGLVVTAWSTFRRPPRTTSAGIVQPRLLLTEFSVDEQAMRVKIRGRLPGMFAFVAKIADVNTETMMLATLTRIEFRTSNLSGEVSQVAPTPSISMIECGFSRPFSSLMLSIIIGAASVGFFYYGESGLGLICVSLCLGLIFLYMLAKRFFIAVQTLGNEAHVLEFRRSFIDKTVIDIDQARRAMALLSKILETHMASRNDAMLDAQKESEEERIEEAVKKAKGKAQ